MNILPLNLVATLPYILVTTDDSPPSIVPPIAGTVNDPPPSACNSHSLECFRWCIASVVIVGVNVSVESLRSWLSPSFRSMLEFFL